MFNFKPNTFLKVEFLPNGKPLFTTNINKNTDPDIVADFINGFVVRRDLEEWLRNIYKYCEGKGIRDIGEAICENVFEFQSDIEVKPIRHNPRNPLIKPSEVSKRFSQGDNDE